MPNQVPYVDLPGAEYFSLAPNRNVAIGPRLVVSVATPGAGITVPANGQGEADLDLLLSPQFQRSSGIYFVRAQAIFGPSDGAAKLTLTAIRLGLGPPPLNNVQLDIGIPYATLTAPTGTVLVIQETNALVTGIDFGPGSTLANSDSLHLYARVVVNNTDAGAAHTFNLRTTAVFHQLEGFVQ